MDSLRSEVVAKASTEAVILLLIWKIKNPLPEEPAAGLKFTNGMTPPDLTYLKR
jgi:hypothetical protein